jgi:hypothetical protein
MTYLSFLPQKHILWPTVEVSLAILRRNDSTKKCLPPPPEVDGDARKRPENEQDNDIWIRKSDDYSFFVVVGLWS